MNDMQYSVLIDLLKGFIQSWGSQYSTNIIEPLVKHVSIQQVSRMHPWRSVNKPYSQVLTVDVDTYSLPYDFDKFNGKIKTKYGYLRELKFADFNILFPDRSGSKAQDVSHYCIEEYEGAKSQPSSAETINVVSSDASDTATVLVRGEVGGYDDYEEVTLNGTTAVTTTKSFTHIAYVSKSEKTNGYITASGTTSGTTFSVVPAEHLTARYKRLILNALPQEALTIVGQYLTTAFYPKKDYDVLRVPSDIVFLNALALLGWERRDVTNQLSIEKKYQEESKIAIKHDRKSFSIDSKMELSNETRKVIPDDYPLMDD